VDEASPFDATLVARLLPKINYPALLQAREQIKAQCHAQNIDLPELLPLDELNMAATAGAADEGNDNIAASDDDNHSNNNHALENLHRILFDIHVQEGHLICPGTGREFAIKDGIPNMILHEDEL
jgi:multifunctional methyltransferase subunit TRM112